MTYTHCSCCGSNIWFDENGFAEKAHRVTCAARPGEMYVCEKCSAKPIVLNELVRIPVTRETPKATKVA